jgi:outer membrane lipoprotein
MKSVNRSGGLLLLVWAAFLITGCAHVVSSELRQQSRTDLAFSTVLQNPEAYKGATVIWGGSIIETVNHDDYTAVKVLQTPLDSYERPEGEEDSRGRFIVEISGYVDPEVYKNGKMVVVAGEIVGKTVQPLGETQYAYPLIKAKEIHLLKKAPDYPHPYYDYWGWYGYPYYRPYYYPQCC